MKVFRAVCEEGKGILRSRPAWYNENEYHLPFFSYFFASFHGSSACIFNEYEMAVSYARTGRTFAEITRIYNNWRKLLQPFGVA